MSTNVTKWLKFSVLSFSFFILKYPFAFSQIQVTNSSSAEEAKVAQTIIKRSAKNTITPVLLNHGDILEFTLRNGQKRTFQLLETDASIMRTNILDLTVEQHDGGTVMQFSCKVLIDGHEMTMQRYLPTQESFYEPYVINGMRIWFDAVQDYFEFFTLKHGWSKPRADARFAVSDALDPVAPDMAMWYPNDRHYINVKNSYLGGDVWMGPYLGGSPHDGLDINTPKGTSLFSPVSITDMDDQWLLVGFEPKPELWAIWRGIKNWPNGSVWTLSVLHLDKYLVEEHSPLIKGTHIAEAAGTGVGAEEHSHFQFMIRDDSTNTVDDRVMLQGNIVFEKENTYVISVNEVVGEVSKSSALYVRRDDRPKDFSIFMVPEKVALINNFNYEIPQIPLDPWYIFWQMFEDDKAREGIIRAQIVPVEPATSGETVYFSSDGSRSGIKTEDLWYYWSFGDGGWSNEKNPAHIYAAPGIYPVSLVVDDGENRDRFTQHITVDGEKVNFPVLSLGAQEEATFDKRKAYVTDIYGSRIPYLPHTLNFVARNTHPQPEAKIISLVNNGRGELADATIDISYEQGKNWLQIAQKNKGNEQKLIVSIDARGLSPDTYIAIVKVTSSEALNSPQSFRICLDVRSNNPESIVVIDDSDSGFYATPYFWVGGRFKRWTRGYKDFYLTNGGRNNEGEYFRFTPDLKKGRYKVSFVPETPFRECKLKVWVHHSKGDSKFSIDPNKSRTIAEFYFSEGMDGFVQVTASGSEGEVIADAVRFEMVNNMKNSKGKID